VSRDGRACTNEVEFLTVSDVAARLRVSEPAIYRRVQHDLVDEYRLMIEPILLGGGKRIFRDDGRARPLELVSATKAATGVLICTYRPAGR
jgi:hypothetical protein